MQLLHIETVIEFDPENKTAKHIKQSSWKNVVICSTDAEIDKYYSWFLQKRFNLELNRSLRKAHVTIVNDVVEDKEAYEKTKQIWNGKKLVFDFDPSDIRTNGEHWWLKVKNEQVAEIRRSCGLNPDPYFNLHLTLGYANEKNLFHSEYIHQQILLFGL